MIDLNLLREHPEDVARGVQAKGIQIDIARILALDAEKRELQTRVEQAAAKKNAASAAVAQATGAERERLIKELRATDDRTDRDHLTALENELHALLWSIPNLPAPDVRMGKNDAENEVLRTWGKPTEFAFAPKASWELGASLGVFDTERAAKVSGSRFGYLTGPGAKLEFALTRFAMRTLEEQGFTPVIPPVLVNAKAMEAMGYTIHGGKEETYYLDRDDQYLVGTSEQSIGPIHMDETLSEAELPKQYMGFSTCFRREAGTYGKDTKGIFRVHQFDKIEMFAFTTPEESDAEHERLLAIEERFLQELNLPYQVVKMCTGDLGVPAARKYDLEAWFPSESRYRELTSTSTCTDWQARRLNIRYRPQTLDPRPPRFVHMLNGTAFAIGRTICCLLENYQQSDGSIMIPEALRADAGMDRIVPL